MKNKFLFFAATLLFALSVKAQIKVGLKGALNIANNGHVRSVFSADGRLVDFNGKHITRFQGGLFADLPLREKLQLRPEVGFSGEGYQLNEMKDLAGNIILEKQIVKLNYISVPVQLLYTPSVSSGTLWFGMGPYAGMLVNGLAFLKNAKVKMGVGNEATEQVKRIDVGLSSTVGLKLKKGVIIGSSYKLGLKDLSPGQFSSSSRNRVLSLFIGYNL